MIQQRGDDVTSPTRVLFLEMDAGDKFLIQRWAADGTMPTWHRLLSDGLVANTRSLDGFFVGSTWPSLYTGTNPARHGFHSLMQLRPGTYDFQLSPPGEAVKETPFWTTLSRAGKRVAVLDVPLSFLSEDLNGVQSVEWGSHDHVYGFCAQPKAFEDEIRRQFGLHPLKEICNSYGRTPADFVQLRDDLIAGIRTKCEITKHTLRQGGWDFFCQVFTESHCIGHQCWHLHDIDHPAHDREVIAITGDPMREVYREIDAAMGSILAEVGDDTLVVVLAGHGMTHKIGAQFLLPQILIRLGVAAPAPPAELPARKRVLDSVLSWAWQRTPQFLKRPLEPLRTRTGSWVGEAGLAIAPHLAAIDAARSKFFVLDNGFPVSGLRVNLKGREPQGLVAPGAEFTAVCTTLAEDLLDIVNARTGQPMVKSVRRTEEIYSGPHLDRLPDLLIEWSGKDVLGSAGCGNPAQSELTVRSNKIGEISGTNTYPRTGDHHPQGLLVAVGPRVVPGRLERTLSLMDLAPTFTSALGIELPDADGVAVGELL